MNVGLYFIMLVFAGVLFALGLLFLLICNPFTIELIKKSRDNE